MSRGWLLVWLRFCWCSIGLLIRFWCIGSIGIRWLCLMCGLILMLYGCVRCLVW